MPVELKPAGVNIMIAVQGAASMLPHWPRIKDAIRELRQSHPDAAFGVHLFWANETSYNGQNTVGQIGPADPTMMGNTTNNFCETTKHKLLEVGDHGGDALLSFLGDTPPGPPLAALYPPSPILDALNYYLANASKLADPTRTNYLVFITDGNDNCFGTFLTKPAMKLLAYEKVAIELRKRNIRTIPVGFEAWTGAGSPTTNQDVLDRLLVNGGSGLKSVPSIDAPAKLAEVVTRVGQTAVNCRFEIPSVLDTSKATNPFELTFGIHGNGVPRDRAEVNGWNFVEGRTDQVEFFGDACQALQSGEAVRVTKSCEANVCGRAAANIRTRPRAVLMLIDSSAARLQCADDSFDCLLPPLDGSTMSTSFQYWEVVINAAQRSFVSPVNDDVEFGMHFFPAKTAAALTCEVAAKPETPPALGTQITMTKQMLEILPFGLKPLVPVLENVAAAPGRLADPGVIGTVIVLSDGGDNCTGGTQSEIVSRLAGASKKLLDAGIKTYAIRYGAKDGQTPEQAEQLAAIVTNGGTASAGSTPYVDAKSASDLENALAAISDQLATCSFTLGELDPKIDRSRANLYVNGGVVGMDANGTKRDGWNWVDSQRTTIELYGAACQSFKTQQRNRVLVEFGCKAEIVVGPE